MGDGQKPQLWLYDVYNRKGGIWMRKLKVTVFTLLLSIPLFLLSGCVKNTKLVEKPIGDYLSENYGIKNEDFKILSAYNGFGVSDIQTYVEIKNHTTLLLF